MSLLGNQEQRALDKSKVRVVILQKILFSSRRCQVFFLEVTTCSCYREPAMTSNNMPLSSARCSTRASGGWPTLSMILRGKNGYLQDKPMFFRVITWQNTQATSTAKFKPSLQGTKFKPVLPTSGGAKFKPFLQTRGGR
jgi:hypothetical protein